MLISNAIVCDVNGEREVDVKIENGMITEIGSNLRDENVIDAKSIYLLPSLVDTNVRVLDSSLNAKNIKAIAKEARKGGVGHIVLNADSNPAIDNEVVLEFAQNGIKDINDVKIDFMLNSLKEDMSLSNIAILLKKGIVAPYMSTIAKNNVAIKIAEYVKMYGVTLFCKPEDNSLINAGVMLEGDVSSKLGLAGIPELSEVLHVSRMIEIARHFGIKILFNSIASPRSVELITKAKSEGVAVSCEVSVHHLLNSDEACEGFNTTAKLNPPLASKNDVKELQNALKRGEIDVLTTLHQPNSPVNKEVAFFDAAYGCEALEDALPIYYTKLVKSGMISMSELVKLTVQNPAKSINIEAGVIEVGQNANLVLFDLNEKRVVDNAQSLYNGEEIFGKVVL
ncbi:amidohydrolase family protein [Sulfurimonas autotrophica]|uniref:Amidohydrolase n=1 Tax=Sulfurimonas autotrophica (strain ATCC BAA-671 / DSM 16294 / JCM 11897 / OK10) TaxID=563040 RepID=E0US30_SULAO|nr:amidohydrolase family protein [Sulfurimonas autotrophica]ADN09053.1 amidohydrolase [Sulfurimonas autotrophica DSM 16294]